MKIPPHPLTGCVVFALSVLVLRAEETAKSYSPLGYVPRGNLGQALVDMEMARHPELKLITVHVTPLGVDPASDKDRCIMGSSIGRIGKPDNQEDIDIFRGGAEKTEVDTEFAKGVPKWSVTQAPKFEVLTPLLVQSGEKAGLLVVVFGYGPGDDTSKYVQIAHAIRDDFKNAIASKDDLLAPAR